MMKIKKALSIFNRFIYGHFGFKSLIYKPMLVSGKRYIFIGKNVLFRNGARIECINQRNTQVFSPKISIGDNTSFEQFAHIISTTDLIIGSNNLISARFFVSTCSHTYSFVNIPITSQKLESKPVKIGNNCFIGMDVKVFPGVTIGDNVIIGANSIVTQDIPSFSVAVGSPAKVIKMYDFNTNRWIRIDKKGIDEI